MSNIVLQDYVVEKLQMILPYEFTTKEEVIKLLKIELAKIQIFDVEELTFYELIHAVCLSKNIEPRTVVDPAFTQALKMYTNFTSISHKTDEVLQNLLDPIKQRYLYDGLEKKMREKYDASFTVNGNKIVFKNLGKNVITLVRPFLSEGRVCFNKVFFNTFTSEEDYLALMPEEFVQTKSPKYVTSLDSNKARVAECKFLLLDELLWIVDNVEFKLINNKTNATTKRLAKPKQDKK